MPYEQVLLATGGQTPYTWTLTGGTLPPGLSLQANGIISGTPTAGPRRHVSEHVQLLGQSNGFADPDRGLQHASHQHHHQSRLDVSAGHSTVGRRWAVNYSATVTASRWNSALHLQQSCSVALPDGLTLTDSGIRPVPSAGHPPTAGTFNFTVQATDSVSEIATAAFTIVITGRLQGGYVISLNGSIKHTAATPFYMVGSFVADGNGNITSGVFDQTGPSG